MNNETPAEARIASLMPDPRETAQSIHRHAQELAKQLTRCPNCRNGFEVDYGCTTELKLKECEMCRGMGYVRTEARP